MDYKNRATDGTRDRHSLCSTKRDRPPRNTENLREVVTQGSLCRVRLLLLISTRKILSVSGTAEPGESGSQDIPDFSVAHLLGQYPADANRRCLIRLFDAAAAESRGDTGDRFALSCESHRPAPLNRVSSRYGVGIARRASGNLFWDAPLSHTAADGRRLGRRSRFRLRGTERLYAVCEMVCCPLISTGKTTDHLDSE